MRRVLARFNFSCNLTGNLPQSLTGHTATVIAHFRKKKLTLYCLLSYIYYICELKNKINMLNIRETGLFDILCGKYIFC